MSWNKQVAVSYLRTHALGRSHSECARYTRLAILAGGVDIGSPNSHYAKDYGANLVSSGFREVPQGSTLIAGDVAIIQPYAGGNGIGHMTMYDGTKWISDFVQTGMYPGPGYRRTHPAFKIYRKD